jgi:site-specific recombinase XerD
MDLEQSIDSGCRLRVSVVIVETLDSYVAYLAGRKVRPRARDVYRREVAALARWIGPDATVADVTPDLLGRYQAAIEHLAAATIGKKLSAIRSWCRWLQRVRLRADDPTLDLQWPRRRRRLPRVLKQEELAQLESILDRPAPILDVKARRLWYRNRRIVLLMLYGGLRRAEVAGLRWADVDLDAACAMVHESSAKGGHERIIFLHQRLVADLRCTPLRERRGAVAGHPDGRCLSHKSIGHIFERWLAAAGLRISAHRLRHTCATEMLRGGAGVRDIQQQLGHADLRTTEGYLDMLTERQRAAVRGLPDRFGG